MFCSVGLLLVLCLVFASSSADSLAGLQVDGAPVIGVAECGV
jgi:hypothetical protein